MQAPGPSKPAGTTGKKRKAVDGRQQSAAGAPQADATLAKGSSDAAVQILGLAKGSSEAAGLLSPGPSLGPDETFGLADLPSHAREALQTCLRAGRAATAAGKHPVVSCAPHAWRTAGWLLGCCISVGCAAVVCLHCLTDSLAKTAQGKPLAVMVAGLGASHARKSSAWVTETVRHIASPACCRFSRGQRCHAASHRAVPRSPSHPGRVGGGAQVAGVGPQPGEVNAACDKACMKGLFGKCQLCWVPGLSTNSDKETLARQHGVIWSPGWSSACLLSAGQAPLLPLSSPLLPKVIDQARCPASPLRALHGCS